MSVAGFVVFCICIATCMAQNVTIQGTVTIVEYQSKILGFERGIQVYLPPNYDQADTTTLYPVIYFLHGFTGNHTSFAYLNEVVDSLITSGAMEPVIVIKPNGAILGTTIGSLWANSIVNGRFEDFLLKEVLPWTDSTYNTDRRREKRFLMGHSFGASASLRLTLQHLDTFGSIACHSGFVKMDEWLVQTYVNTSVFTENNGSAIAPVPGFNPAKIFTIFVFTASKAWSPDFTSPYNVTLPMRNDGSGIINPTVVDMWSRFSPHIVINGTFQGLKERGVGVLYMDIGRADELLLLQPNLDFAAELQSLNYPNPLFIYQGPHNDPTILRVRFNTSVSMWGDYLKTLNQPAQENPTEFPWVLVFAPIGGFIVSFQVENFKLKIKLKIKLEHSS
eukprot:TRINITY_DN3188_c0_g1_i1.p1 TRINITY_DN3188_c0_g1~~TRINITY_DN3188_c0_g1_i1.p1  ORF type:complete len:391 (-),score=90.22 TRINITY_DN3188_c0_g1_i1:267-1439(-)